MFEAHQDELNGLISEAIGVMREAMLEENMQVRIRAAQEVLRTAGLRMAMKAEAPASREEIINEFLGEMIKNSTMEMGIVEAKQLGSGEEGT
ncbi:MAG: hypothetical protein Q7J07_02335 [Pelolinea sp.]|nr:hypothetical protein [Pelolinea sp.]